MQGFTRFSGRGVGLESLEKENKKNRDYTIQSVSKALNVIDIMADAYNGVGVTAVANSLGIAKSSAHRLLTTLEKAGYVKTNELTGRYHLTFKIFEAGSKLLRGKGFNEHVSFLLEQLSLKTNCLVKMCVEENFNMLCVYRINARQVFRMDLSTGTHLPLHCTGVGKAFLASLNEDELSWYLRYITFERFTPSTITTADRLMKEIKLCKARGYAVDRGEHSEEVWGIAAPVFNHLGQTMSTISVSGPASAIRQMDIEHLGSEVMETARKVSVIIGYV
jgi:DNA-binding IclR family transcriptional regulator